MKKCFDARELPGLTLHSLDEAKDLKRCDACISSCESAAKFGLNITYVVEKPSAVDRDFDPDLQTDPTRFREGCQAKAEAA